MESRQSHPLLRFWPLLLLLLLPLLWLIPAGPRVALSTAGPLADAAWPQMWVEPPEPQPGEATTAVVRDHVPWPFVRLTVNGQPAEWGGYDSNPDGTWSWRWHFTMPDAPATALTFYRNCDRGCLERGRVLLEGAQPRADAPEATTLTKLCTVFPDPERDWHGQRGWGVELTYASLAEEAYWGVDDLAARVQEAAAQGLRLLVRVDYAQGQSVPPAGDRIALDQYLDYVARLARDERLHPVYGYVIGSGYNTVGSNQQAPDSPVTPAWYARLFNGYGEPLDHSDNVVQRVRAVNPQVRVLVGPVQPWKWEQDGARPYQIDVPWLNYMNTLVALLDEAARAKSAAGIPLTAPDGFALHVPGRPDAPELDGRNPAEEPRLSLPRSEWEGAQAGFRLYEEWLDIINRYPTTRGLPAFITATNTFSPDGGVPPAQSYPRGWLTTALAVVNGEPQIQALCWFIDRDRSGDPRWNLFSLHTRAGRLLDAAEEFDALLRGQ